MSQTAEQKAAADKAKADKAAADKLAAEQKAAADKEEADKKAAETTEITFKRSHPAYAYWPGDKAEINAEKAAELIEGGFAE